MCFAVPGQIMDVFPEGEALMARADFAGTERKICLDYLPDLTVGDYTIVHAGYALSKVDEAEAQTIISTMNEYGLL